MERRGSDAADASDATHATGIPAVPPESGLGGLAVGTDGRASAPSQIPLRSDDVERAAAWAGGALASVPDGRWRAEGVTTDWDPRRTVDHIVDTLLLYTALVTARATGMVAPPRSGNPTLTPAELIGHLRSSAAALAGVLADMAGDGRAYHPSGLADREGWVGMAATEILVHSHDALSAAGCPRGGPADLADRVVDRVLPWTPPGPDGWQRLLAATGRAVLPGHPPTPATWWWQSAPLAEWDGTPRLRTRPPLWR